MANAGTISFELTGNTAQFQKALAQATAKMNGLSTKAKSMSASNAAAMGIMSYAATVMGMKVLAGFRNAITGFAEYEAALDRAGSIAGLDRGSEKIREMSDLAKQLGATTKFTSTEVTGAYKFMAMAGMKANQIMASTPAVLQLASAGAIELGQAANIVTNIMAGFGKQTSELAQVNDILVSTITGANVDISQLGHAFKMAGPVAKAAGMDFKEAAASIAMMGNAGIQGTLAGTALRGAMAHLLSPTKRAKAILAELGVTVKDASGDMRPLTDILADLEYNGMTAGEAIELFGVRAGPGMMALIEQGTDALYEFQERLEESAGRAAELEARSMQTLAGQFKKISSAANNAALQLGEYMGPAIKEVGEATLKLIGIFVKVAKIWGTLISGFYDSAVLMKELWNFQRNPFGDSNELKIAAKNYADVFSSAWGQIKTFWEEPIKVGDPEIDYSTWEKVGLKTGEVFGGKIREATEKAVKGFDFSLESNLVTGSVETRSPSEIALERYDRMAGGYNSEKEKWTRDANTAEMNARIQQDLAKKEKQARIESVQSITQYTNQLGQGFQAAGNVAMGFAQGGFWGAMAALGMEVLKETEFVDTLNKSLEDTIGAFAKLVDAFGPLLEVLHKFSGIDQLNDVISWSADVIEEGVEKLVGSFEWAVTGFQTGYDESATIASGANVMGHGTPVGEMSDMSAAFRVMDGRLEGFSESSVEKILEKAEKFLEYLGEELFGIETSGMKTSADGYTKAELLGWIDNLSESLEEGSEILGDTVSGMNETLTNVPQGLKISLARYNAILESNLPQSGGGGGTASYTPQTSDIVQPGITVQGDVIVNGATNVDEIIKTVEEEAVSYRASTTGVIYNAAGISRSWMP